MTASLLNLLGSSVYIRNQQGSTATLALSSTSMRHGAAFANDMGRWSYGLVDLMLDVMLESSGVG